MNTRPSLVGDTSAGLGVRLMEDGAEFAIFSQSASLVELVILKPETREVERRIPMQRHEDSVWRVCVPGVRAGTRYGYRVSGDWDPARGLRSNQSRLLLDPYAKGVLVPEVFDEGCYDYVRQPSEHKPSDIHSLSASPLESFGAAAIGVVCDSKFDWTHGRHPNVSWKDTLIYEAHVKGLTHLHPQVPPEMRGTYAGVASEPVIRHLQALGVTAIELLPVHASLTEPWLRAKGLTNYWGYNTLSFFAPDPRFASSRARANPEKVLNEFQEMVRTLHIAGIEVILDVVYNHTAEGDAFGPTYSFRGIDNRSYYRQLGDGRYEDFTGCGNTLDAANPAVLRLVLDSARFWAMECGVDGFRFDLASAISRNRSGDFLEDSPLAHALLQDPYLSQRKLIFEPWDATAEGYALGRSPRGISEWNGRYRDTIRRFWRGDPGLIPDVASALSGSSNLFESRGGGTASSINFITVHDGFTLRDLVSYDARRNDANGEEGRDGAPENFSSSYGTEGPGSPELEALRTRQTKNLLATLFFSLGVPMLLGGDEGGRTQQGNNNSYCHDGPISWVDWERMSTFAEIRELIAFLSSFRRQFGPLRRAGFLRGRGAGENGRPDVLWMSETGVEIKNEAWTSLDSRTLGVYLSDEGSGSEGDSLFIMMNPTTERRSFRISSDLLEHDWRLLLRTDEPVPFRKALHVQRGDSVEVPDRTLLVFRSGGMGVRPS